MSKGCIVYVGGFELPDRNAAAQRVVANGKIFRELGYDVVFVGVTQKSKSDEPTIRRDEDHFGFECWSIPYPKAMISWLSYIVGVSSLMKFMEERISQNVVAVICYNFPAIAQLRIHAACRRARVMHFPDATEWSDSSAGSLLYRVVKRLDTTMRMRFVNPTSNGVITTSRYLTEFYNSKGLVTLELPTLYDAENFSRPPRHEERTVKKLIYVGTPFESVRVNKSRANLKERLDRVVVLLSLLYDEGLQFEFDVYGIARDDYLKVFPEHESILSAMCRVVRFHGRKPHREVLKEVASSDFSIFFRDKTRVTLAGFPSKLAESVSVGTPVITNRMMSVEKYAHNPALFFIEKEHELDQLREILFMPAEQVQNIKQAAFESREFDYRSFVPQVLDFMNRTGCKPTQ